MTLSKLEDIAVNLSKLMETCKPEEKEQESVSYEHMTPEELLELSTRIRDNTELWRPHYDATWDELEKLAEKVKDVNYDNIHSLISESQRVISWLDFINERVERNRKEIGRIVEEREKKLLEGKYPDYKTASDEYFELLEEISKLRNEHHKKKFRERLLDRSEYKRKLKELNKKREPLSELINLLHKSEFQFPVKFNYHKEHWYPKYKKDVLGKLCSFLNVEYDKLWEASEAKITQLSQDIIDSLMRDNFTKYGIEEKALEHFHSSKTSEEIFQIMKELGDTNEEDYYKRLAEIVADQEDANRLEHFLQRYTKDENAFSVRTYQNVIRALQQFAQLPKRLEIIDSAIGTGLMYHNSEWEKRREKVSKIDLVFGVEKWKVFRENEKTRKIFGDDLVDKFDEYVADHLWDVLLAKKEQTEQSIRIGKEAYSYFNHTKHVPYQIINFWRETGSRGDMPYVSTNVKPEKTKAGKYISSISEEQLKEIEQLNIPGLMGVINTVRDNLSNFTDDEIGEGDKVTENPAYKDIQNNLAKICSHYLTKGTTKEKYFVSRLAFRMMCEGNSDPELPDAISTALELSDEHKANFKNHYEDFIGTVIRQGPDEGNLIALARLIESLGDFYSQLEVLIENSDHPEELREEAKKVKEKISNTRTVTTTCGNAIPYLKDFDESNTQKYLKDKKHGDFYKRILERNRIMILDSDLNWYLPETSDSEPKKILKKNFEDCSSFVGKLDEIIENSDLKEFLKKEQQRMLNDIIRSGANGNFVLNFQEKACVYLEALNDKEIAGIFESLRDPEKAKIMHITNATPQASSDLVSSVIRNVIKFGYPIGADFPNRLIQKDIENAEDLHIHYIPHCKKEGTEEKTLVDMFARGLKDNYLFAYHQLNNEHLQGVFDIAHSQIKGNAEGYLRNSVDEFLRRNELELDEQEKESVYKIAWNSKKDGYMILKAIKKNELSKNNSHKKLHLDFLVKLSERSGSARYENLRAYRLLVEDFTASADDEKSQNRCIKDLQSLIGEYIGFEGETQIKVLSVPIFRLFEQRDTKEERKQFLQEYKRAQRDLLTQQEYVPENFSNEDLEVIIKDLVNFEKFSFNKPDCTRMIYNHLNSDIESVNPALEIKTVGISKVGNGVKNQNLEAMQRLYNQVLFCYSGEELVDETPYMQKQVDEFKKALDKQISALEKNIEDPKLEKAKKFMRKKLNDYNKVRTLLQENEKTDDHLMFALYLANSNADKEIQKAADGLKERILVYKTLKLNPGSKEVRTDVNVNQNYYSRSELSWLASFYGHLQNGLGNIEIDDYQELFDELKQNGISFKAKRKKTVNQVADYFSRIFEIDKPQQIVNKYPLNMIQEELGYLKSRQKKLEEKIELTFIPGRGLIDEFAGAMGNACYLGEEVNFIQKYSNVTNVRIVQDYGSDPSINGNALMIRQDVAEGDKVIPNVIIRADNPNLTGLDVDEYLNAIENYFTEQFGKVLKAEGYTGKFYVTRPKDNQSNYRMTNRAELFVTAVDRIKDCKKVKLQEDFKFNGYTLQDSCVVVGEGMVK